MSTLASEVKAHSHPRPPRGDQRSKRFSSFTRSQFQSTLPSRGATEVPVLVAQPSSHFNPRSPRGERQYGVSRSSFLRRFQSTLPSRGATGKDRGLYQYLLISIHAPLAGSDTIHAPGCLRRMLFQSTLPSRGATDHLRHQEAPE